MVALDMIIEKARAVLPIPCDSKQENYSVPLSVQEFREGLRIVLALLTGPDIKQSVLVVFRKQYMAGVCVGWEFVMIEPYEKAV